MPEMDNVIASVLEGTSVSEIVTVRSDWIMCTIKTNEVETITHYVRRMQECLSQSQLRELLAL